MVEAVEPVEHGSWWETFYASMSPAGRRNVDRHMRVTDIEIRMQRYMPWMRWPLLRLVYGFWSNLFDEGIVATCKPRWGALTFGYLNDGNDPSLWHTCQEVFGFGNRKYSALYPAGAPRSKYEADNYVEIHKDWFGEDWLKRQAKSNVAQ